MKLSLIKYWRQQQWVWTCGHSWERAGCVPQLARLCLPFWAFSHSYQWTKWNPSPLWVWNIFRLNSKAGSITRYFYIRRWPAVSLWAVSLSWVMNETLSPPPLFLPSLYRCFSLAFPVAWHYLISMCYYFLYISIWQWVTAQGYIKERAHVPFLLTTCGYISLAPR